jgi:hypothetical protein
MARETPSITWTVSGSLVELLLLSRLGTSAVDRVIAEMIEAMTAEEVGAVVAVATLEIVMTVLVVLQEATPASIAVKLVIGSANAPSLVLREVGVVVALTAAEAEEAITTMILTAIVAKADVSDAEQRV